MKYLTSAFYYLLIIFLLLFSFGTVIYNTVKLIPEYNEWGMLTDVQKRKKIFGSLYDEYTFITNHTKDKAEILFYSPDGMEYYVLRYYLYPKKLISASSVSEFTKLADSKRFTYLVISHFQKDIPGYQKKNISTSKNFVTTFYTLHE